MPKWEYCVIQASQLTALSIDGYSIQSIKKDKAKGDDSDLAAKLRLIAELGKDGWEMVNFLRLSINDEGTYWFKRLINE